jgi:hypothetical protein
MKTPTPPAIPPSAGCDPRPPPVVPRNDTGTKRAPSSWNFEGKLDKMTLAHRCNYTYFLLPGPNSSPFGSVLRRLLVKRGKTFYS